MRFIFNIIVIMVGANTTQQQNGKTTQRRLKDILREKRNSRKPQNLRNMNLTKKDREDNNIVSTDKKLKKYLWERSRDHPYTTHLELSIVGEYLYIGDKQLGDLRWSFAAPQKVISERIGSVICGSNKARNFLLSSFVMSVISYANPDKNTTIEMLARQYIQNFTIIKDKESKKNVTLKDFVQSKVARGAYENVEFVEDLLPLSHDVVSTIYKLAFPKPKEQPMDEQIGVGMPSGDEETVEEIVVTDEFDEIENN